MGQAELPIGKDVLDKPVEIKTVELFTQQIVVTGTRNLSQPRKPNAIECDQLRISLGISQCVDSPPRRTSAGVKSIHKYNYLRCPIKDFSYQ